MSEIRRERSSGVDIIKIIAILSVVLVHFFLKTGYYYTPVEGANMLVQSYLRWVLLVGVPLFLLCTGYLSWQKTVSRRYYLKLFTRVLIPYLLISALCLLVRQHEGETFTLREAVLSFFRFSANSYAWYINMFIGIYLLAPVLNCAVNALQEKQLRAVIAVLGILILLPATFNAIFEKYPEQTWIWFPDWWDYFYPVLYYFIGASLARFPLRIRKPWAVVAIVLIPCLQTALQLRINRLELDNWFLTQYNSVFVAAQCVLLFLLLYDVRVKRAGIRKALGFLSGLTLETYLFSNITDLLIYPWLDKHVFSLDGVPLTAQQRFLFFPLVPLTSFLAALLLAAVFHFLYGGCQKGLRRLSRAKQDGAPPAADENTEENKNIVTGDRPEDGFTFHKEDV